MAISKRRFFDHVRKNVFGGRLTKRQVDGMEALLDACSSFGVQHPSHVSYVLASVYHETGRTMAPVREGFALSDAHARSHVANLYARGQIKRNYALPHANGNSYYGRGQIQLTHGENYAKLGKALRLSLYANPDLALKQPYSARIAVYGMAQGVFTGHKLSDHLPGDYFNARRIVNGLDRAGDIAVYARAFERSILAAITSGIDPDPRPPYNGPSMWERVWNWLRSLFN